MTNFKVRESSNAGTYQLARESFSGTHPANMASPLASSAVQTKVRSDSTGSRPRSGSWRASAAAPQGRSRSGSWRDQPKPVIATTEVNYSAGGTLSRSTRPRSGSNTSQGSVGSRPRTGSWRRDSNSMTAWSNGRSRASSWRQKFSQSTIGGSPPKRATLGSSFSASPPTMGVLGAMVPSEMAKYDRPAVRSLQRSGSMGSYNSVPRDMPVYTEKPQHQDHSAMERKILLDTKREMKDFVSTVTEFSWFRGKRVMHTSIPEELQKRWNCTNIRTMGTWKQLDDYGIDLAHFRLGQKVKMIVQSVFIHDRKPDPELRGIPDPNFIHIIKEEKQERSKTHLKMSQLRADVFDTAREAFQSYVSTVVDVMDYRGHTVMWTSVPKDLKERFNTTDLKTVNAWPELAQAGINLKIFKRGDQVKMIVSDVAVRGKYAHGPLLYGLPDWNAPMNERFLKQAVVASPEVERTSLDEFLEKAFDMDKQDEALAELKQLDLGAQQKDQKAPAEEMKREE